MTFFFVHALWVHLFLNIHFIHTAPRQCMRPRWRPYQTLYVATSCCTFIPICLSEIFCTSITYNDKSFWYHYWLIYWYLTLDSSRREKTKSVLYLAIVCDECSQFLISLFFLFFFQYTVHCWVAFEKGEHCSFSSESQAPKLWCEVRKKRQNYEYIYIYRSW